MEHGSNREVNRNEPRRADSLSPRHLSRMRQGRSAEPFSGSLHDTCNWVVFVNRRIAHSFRLFSIEADYFRQKREMR